MKKFHLGIFVLLLISGTLPAQSFNKGSLLVSISEGTTYSHFVTTDNSTNPAMVSDNHICGDRDPLIVEYGISKKWGIGINMGGDVFHSNPDQYYNVVSKDKKIITSELTVEGNYHFYNTRKWDLAGCLSLGLAGVAFNGYISQIDGDGINRAYRAGGGIVRLSGKARYYIFKRFGLVGIISTYASSCKPDPTKDNILARQTNTSISGYAYEFGLCYRILK